MVGLNERLSNAVSVLPSVHVQPGGAPHILNLSFEGAMGEVVVNALGARGIMVSTTSACASKFAALNETLLAMDNTEAFVKWRIRISFLSFTKELEADIIIDELNRVKQLIEGVIYDYTN